MKVLKSLILSCLLACLAIGCSKPAATNLNVLFNTLSVDAAGGSQEVSFLSNQSWSVRVDGDWLSVSPLSGGPSDSYQKLTVSASENPEETARTATVTLTAGDKSAQIGVTQAGAPRFTIRDFRAKKADKTTWYKLTGEIASVENEEYGNFFLVDETGFVYVYGLCQVSVPSNDKSFAKLGLKVGDSVTMMTLRSEHNDMIEAGGQTPAYFVSKTAGSYKLGRKVSSTSAGWLELPATSASDGQDLLIHSFPDGSRNYAAYWDYGHLVSSWVAYPLCAGNIGTGERTDKFTLDPLLARDKQPYLPTAYKAGNAGLYDRGHQIPSADRWSYRVNLETFFGTNMTPQDNGLNSNVWAILEGKVRGWAKNAATDTLYVVTGCSVKGSDKYVLDADGKHVTVPTGYYKALLRRDKDKNYTAAGFWFDNQENKATSIQKSMSMSIDKLEEKVGVDFFVNLPADVQKNVEAQDPAEVAWWWNN